MPVEVGIIAGGFIALVLAILCCIFILPERKRARLPMFFKFLHDLFNFKFLILEYILKFFYMLCTIGCISVGFFLLFSGESYRRHFESAAPIGLLLIIAGPILVRIVYELEMMFIITVSNVTSIKRKLYEEGAGEKKNIFAEYKSAKPVAPVTPMGMGNAPQMGMPAAPAKVCSACGTPNNPASGFCVKCGCRF